jgi:Bacterial transcriptional activator domain
MNGAAVTGDAGLRIGILGPLLKIRDGAAIRLPRGRTGCCASRCGGQLLRALPGAGRQAEAIGEYHRAREILAVQLGLDPSRELQDLYGRLLQADWREEPAGQP